MTTEKRKLKAQKKSVNVRKKEDVNEDSDSSGPGSNESKNNISKDTMDYNAPKPGPHAKVISFLFFFLNNLFFSLKIHHKKIIVKKKAGEWRKWKQMSKKNKLIQIDFNQIL